MVYGALFEAVTLRGCDVGFCLASCPAGADHFTWMEKLVMVGEDHRPDLDHVARPVIFYPPAGC